MSHFCNSLLKKYVNFIHQLHNISEIERGGGLREKTDIEKGEREGVEIETYERM